MKTILHSIILLVLLSVFASAQTGGNYDLSHNVIASGGGANSTGGNFTVDGTVGQAVAGTNSTGGAFNLRGGFWAFGQLAPTAASVSISGRVMTANGYGITNAHVTLTGADNVIRSTQTGSFGYFRFEEVEVGQTYILEVRSKRYQFAPQVLTVMEEISDLNFTAEK